MQTHRKRPTQTPSSTNRRNSKQQHPAPAKFPQDKKPISSPASNQPPQSLQSTRTAAPYPSAAGLSSAGSTCVRETSQKCSAVQKKRRTASFDTIRRRDLFSASLFLKSTETPLANLPHEAIHMAHPRTGAGTIYSTNLGDSYAPLCPIFGQ